MGIKDKTQMNRFFTSVYETLKPGGIFLMLTNPNSPEYIMEKKGKRTYSDGLKSQIIFPCIYHDDDNKMISLDSYLWKRKTWVKQLKEAGFHKVETSNITPKTEFGRFYHRDLTSYLMLEDSWIYEAFKPELLEIEPKPE